MINLILTFFIACGDKEENVTLEESSVEQNTTEEKIETSEDYSTSLNKFKSAVKVVNTDAIQVEVFETVEKPVQTETTSNEKVDLAE